MPGQAKVRLGSNIPSKPIRRNFFSLYFRGGWVAANFSLPDLGRFNKSRQSRKRPRRRLAWLGLFFSSASFSLAGSVRKQEAQPVNLAAKKWAQKKQEHHVCFRELPSNTHLLNFFFFFFNLRGWFIKANFLLRMKRRIMFLVLIHKEDLHFIHTIKVLLMETSR